MNTESIKRKLLLALLLPVVLLTACDEGRQRASKAGESCNPDSRKTIYSPTEPNRPMGQYRRL